VVVVCLLRLPYSFCCYPDCHCCGSSSPPPESVPFHHHCFELFRQGCPTAVPDPLSRLWTLGAWRAPWCRARPAHLLSPPPVHRDILRTLPQTSGLGLLHALPTELLVTIHDYSRHSLLWRYVAVFRLAHDVSTTNPKPLLTFPLQRLSTWERDGIPQLMPESESASPLPTMRLTLDPTGISKVERLPGPPPYAGECSRAEAFIMEDAPSISGVTALFKVRLRQTTVWYSST
jgi:hypothetical protein